MLTIELLAQGVQSFKGDPMNAIHRTGVDRFLNSFGAVAVLADRTRPPQALFNHKGVGGHMGAVTAADADGFIHPDRLFSKRTTQTPGSQPERGNNLG